MRLLLLSALLAGKVAGECRPPTKELVLGNKGKPSEYCCSEYCCSKKAGDTDCDCGYGDKPMKPEPALKPEPREKKQCATTRGVTTTTAGDPKNFDFNDFLDMEVKELKIECKAAEGKWLGNNKKGNCYEKTWCEQFSKDKTGCKKAKVGKNKVCKYKKARKAKNGKKARDAKCAIKKKSKESKP